MIESVKGPKRVLADAGAARAVALDPCNGCRVGANYLTVATGRDYTDVAPTSGTYLGPVFAHGVRCGLGVMGWLLGPFAALSAL